MSRYKPDFIDKGNTVYKIKINKRVEVNNNRFLFIKQ